jgi:hypothetical protein
MRRHKVQNYLTGGAAFVAGGAAGFNADTILSQYGSVTESAGGLVDGAEGSTGIAPNTEVPPTAPATIETAPALYTVQPGDTLSELLHARLLEKFDAGELNGPAGLTRSEVSDYMLDNFPELAQRGNPNISLSADQWKSIADIDSGNPHNIMVGEKINLDALVDKMDTAKWSPDTSLSPSTGPLPVSSPAGDVQDITIKDRVKVQVGDFGEDTWDPSPQPAESVRYESIQTPQTPISVPSDMYTNPVAPGKTVLGFSDVEFRSVEPINGNYLKTSTYSDFIDQTFGGPEAFDRVVDSGVKNLEAKTYGLFDSARSFNSPYTTPLEIGEEVTDKTLETMTIAEVRELNETLADPAAAKQFAETHAFKYETLRAWLNQVDILTDKATGLPFTEKTPFGDLFSRSVADQVLQKGVKGS